ncbi:MAG TPA: hypothetical protein V6C71_10935 [Coleofasciculaceae cyanobacterium]|jgi:hypothetical protein
MKIENLFLTVFILFFSTKNVVAGEPEIRIDESSKYVKSNLYTQKQNYKTLNYTSSYYSNLDSQKNCEIYKAITP